jgi:hypothetical protein
VLKPAVALKSTMRSGALFALVLLGALRLAAQVPTVTSVAPSQGPVAGGTAVTVTGTNLAGSALSLDGVPVTAQSVSATQVTFGAPPHVNGIASVHVATSAGDAYGEFLYVPPFLSDLPAGYITTVAGIGSFVGFHRQAPQSVISSGSGFCFDTKGNTYLAEPGFNWISVVRPSGVREPFAATSPVNTPNAGSGGPAQNCFISFPRGVTADSSGKVYFTDQGSRVWSVDTGTGIATVIAGNGTAGFSGDGGPSVSAVVGDTTHITGDGNGTIYFVDFNQVNGGVHIRKITPDGTITTAAGNGTQGFSGDGGPATQAEFNFGSPDLGNLALDPSGNLFVADTENQRIRRVDAKTGTITTVAGPTGPAGFALTNLFAVATDSHGNIYYGYNPGITATIVEIDPTGKFLASYGGKPGSSNDGTAVAGAALGGYVSDIGIDPDGNIDFSNGDPAQVRRLNLSTGLLETVAGVGVHPIGENGPAVATVLGITNGDLAFLPTGELLVGDSTQYLLRQIDTSGNISTLAGYGVTPPQPDQMPVVALDAHVYPVAIRTDAAGQIYLSDVGSIYRIDLGGYMNLFAGAMSQFGYSGDGGPATAALLNEPWDIAFDSAGNMFIADAGNNRVRRVDAVTGDMTTVAGSGPVNPPEHYKSNGDGSDTGDGGPATQATLDSPYGVALDANDNLYISSGNFPGYIRKVDAQTGIITTFATIQGSLSKLTFDGAGNIYTMVNSQDLMRIDPSGNQTTIAGGNVQGFSGDGGPASQALLAGGYQASGLTIDAQGDIYFIDGQNLRVRAIRRGAVPAAVIAPANPGHLVNLSCRALVGAGASQLIVGFTVSPGSAGTEPLLIRASGPALASFGVAGTLADPQLTLNSTSGVIAADNGWAGDTQVASAAASVGAFPWTVPTSHDSGLVQSLPGGGYTAQIAGSSGDTGVALAEVYDATQAGAYTPSSPRLVNLSARVNVGTGGNILIAGFVIGGTTAKTVLIRGSGPALAAFGVPGTLADPKLQLYHSNSDGSSTLLQSNTGWGGNPRITSTAASVGAFPWGTAATPDSAILASLAPGSYTAQVSGASGDTGVALVEVYDVP